MDTTEIIVVVAGVAAIAFVLLYFFGEREAMTASDRSSNVIEPRSQRAQARRRA